METTKKSNAPYTHNIKADKEFHANLYLDMVHVILKEARKKGIHYARAYSEPRVNCGYSTKLYFSHIGNLKKLQLIADNNFPGKFIVDVRVGTYLHHGSRFSGAANLEIKPRDKNYFMNKK